MRGELCGADNGALPQFPRCSEGREGAAGCGHTKTLGGLGGLGGGQAAPRGGEVEAGAGQGQGLSLARVKQQQTYVYDIYRLSDKSADISHTGHGRLSAAAPAPHPPKVPKAPKADDTLQAWLEGCRDLPSAPPAGFSDQRWVRIVGRVDDFLDRWAETAIDLGWTTLDVFGCDEAAPDRRFDCMGLVLLLDRCRIVGIDAAGADLASTIGDARQRFRRRPMPPGTVPLWQLVQR